MITLQPITRENWQEALTLTIAPEQMRFVADHAPVALVGLAKAYVQPGGRLWLPFAFHDGEQMVGFMTLAFNENHPIEAWIYHFFIDQRYQGHGLGAESLKALLLMVADRFSMFRRLYLTVHPANSRAQRLYHAAGFRPTGAEVGGEPIYCLELI